jgi:phosphatidylglycerol:prolipoprotein diacylglycerol transferase
MNCLLLCFVGGIVGARLYFVFLKWNEFALHPVEILETWKGGLSIHGGIIGALVTGCIYCRLTNLSVLVCADILSIAAILGQSIGRWGNFFNNELFGYPVSSTFPLKLYIPPEYRPARFQHADYFHPTFLYESVWDLFVFLILYYLAPKLKDTPGLIFMLYLLLYSTGRIFIESMRSDSIMYAGIQVPMIACTLSILIALIGIIVLLIRHKQANI